MQLVSRVKELETALERTEQQLRLFQKISRFMVREMSLQEVLQGIVSLVVEFMRCDSCLLYLLDGDDLVLCASNTPHPDAIGKVRLQLGEGLTGWVARERRFTVTRLRCRLGLRPVGGLRSQLATPRTFPARAQCRSRLGSRGVRPAEPGPTGRVAFRGSGCVRAAAVGDYRHGTAAARREVILAAIDRRRFREVGREDACCRRRRITDDQRQIGFAVCLDSAVQGGRQKSQRRRDAAVDAGDCGTNGRRVSHESRCVRHVARSVRL